MARSRCTGPPARPGLELRIALVTGGGGGIGTAIARKFAEAGALVAVADKRLDAAKVVADSIVADGGAAMAWAIDVSDSSAVTQVIDEIEQRLGAIDILVNSAGLRDLGSCLALGKDEWNAVLGVNLTGAFLCSQAVARSLKERASEGSILSIGSVAGTTALADRVAYVASKHGLVGLTRALAWELGSSGIRVNAIAPGGVDTPMARETFVRFPEKLSVLKNECPMGRLAGVDEIADLALFLVSDAARFMSGAIVPLDGGFLAGRTL